MSKPRSQIFIRPLRLTDLEEVMEIEPIAFGSHHWSRQSFINELNNTNGHYFAAFDRTGKWLLGYSGFWLIGEEAHITTLAVHPDFRRLHVGERLLINDIIQAQKVWASWITLEVRVSNENAQQLYYKFGFKSLGIRKSYYQDNDEDALVLWTENISTPEFKQLLDERIEALDALEQEDALGFNGLDSGDNGVATKAQTSKSHKMRRSRSKIDDDN